MRQELLTLCELLRSYMRQELLTLCELLRSYMRQELLTLPELLRSYMRQELLTLCEHLGSPPVFGEVYFLCCVVCVFVFVLFVFVRCLVCPMLLLYKIIRFKPMKNFGHLYILS